MICAHCSHRRWRHYRVTRVAAEVLFALRVVNSVRTNRCRCVTVTVWR